MRIPGFPLCHRSIPTRAETGESPRTSATFAAVGNFNSSLLPEASECRTATVCGSRSSRNRQRASLGSREFVTPFRLPAILMPMVCWLKRNGFWFVFHSGDSTQRSMILAVSRRVGDSGLSTFMIADDRRTILTRAPVRDNQTP